MMPNLHGDSFTDEAPPGPTQDAIQQHGEGFEVLKKVPNRYQSTKSPRPNDALSAERRFS
jgi:hypothetical protein